MPYRVDERGILHESSHLDSCRRGGKLRRGNLRNDRAEHDHLRPRPDLAGQVDSVAHCCGKRLRVGSGIELAGVKDHNVRVE